MAGAAKRFVRWSAVTALLLLICTWSIVQWRRTANHTPTQAKVTQAGLVLNDTHLGHSYCHSTVSEVNAGTRQFLALLNNVTAKPYFRYFKVNSERPCPYWAVSLLCTSPENACEVCICDKNAIPEALRESSDMSAVDIPTSRVEQSLRPPSNIDAWGQWSVGAGGGGGAALEEEEDDGAKYVDLVLNPEGNTGFAGPLAAKVWQAIYNENCLRLEHDAVCAEVGVLRTLLSGLHFSINVQVTTNFYKDPELKSPQHHAGIYNNPNISFFPNCDMYRRRIAPFPEYIENLYILYQFLLRAVTKAKPLLLSDLTMYNTGAHGTATADDKELHYLLQTLFDARLLCVATFDETQFLETPRGRELIPQIERVLHNVTLLMDCVTCEKCRIWGKVATKGLFTAMRILTQPSLLSNPTGLTRAEKVTLVNVLRQVAFSVYNVQRLAEVCLDEGKNIDSDRTMPSHGDL